MNGPSKSWRNARRAALERAERAVIDPLEPLFTIYASVCVFYLVGFLRFQFFDHTAGYTWIETIQILTVAAAGILVPILTGSVLTVHFASRRLRKIAAELR